jgi:hypothetical protein
MPFFSNRRVPKYAIAKKLLKLGSSACLKQKPRISQDPQTYSRLHPRCLQEALARIEKKSLPKQQTLRGQKDATSRWETPGCLRARICMPLARLLPDAINTFCRYITSYAKALSPKVTGIVDDYLFESHENIPVRRIVSLKKSPIVLMKLVSEKMMMKHGWFNPLVMRKMMKIVLFLLSLKLEVVTLL